MTPQRRSSQGRQDLRAVRVTLMIVIILITQIVCSRKLAAQSVDFEKQIAPLFVVHCLECHRERNPKES